MRQRGVAYDTGSHPTGVSTRAAFDPDAARRELRMIAGDLNCTAVRITGDDPVRLGCAAEIAADVGLEVWLSPFPCEMGRDAMTSLFTECARQAENLRARGADVVLVLGGELSIFAPGFLSGADLFARVATLRKLVPHGRQTLTRMSADLSRYLEHAVAAVRHVFTGPVTYASAPYEQIDWTPFDFVGVDAYRAAHNFETFAEEVRRHKSHGKPVAVTEFGCCAYRGAADRGANGWMIVDRDARPPALDADYVRDEQEQADYAGELVDVFEAEGVDTAFWFTFAGYNFPYNDDPRLDLDMASYGLVKFDSAGASLPKAAFHALAAAYGASGTSSVAYPRTSGR